MSLGHCVARALLAVCLAHAQFASSADIKGIALGMSDADLLSMDRYFQCNDQVPDYCEYDDTVGGAAGHFFVTLEDGRVVCVRIDKIDVSKFGDVVTAMTKKFGKPSRVQSGVVQNGFGAKFPQHIYVWRGADWQAEATERDDSVNTSSLLLISLKYAKRFDEEQKKAANDM